MSSRAGRLACGAALALALLPAREAAASESIRVSVVACALQTSELSRLVRLELSSVLGAAASGSYDVTIRCRESGIDLALFDPITDKKLERTVQPPSPEEPEPERLVALTVAQLYRTAWLELVVDDAPPLAPVRTAPPVSPREVSAAKRAAERSSPREKARPLPWSVALVGGAHARNLARPIVLPAFELALTWSPMGPPWWLLIGAGVEWAGVRRSPGTVGVLLVRAGTGVGLEPLVYGPFSAFTELTVGVGWSRLTGEEVREGFGGSILSGPGFEGSLTLGAAARVGSARFELVSRFGLLDGTPTGFVAGDASVSPDGPWLGGGARLRWLF